MINEKKEPVEEKPTSQYGADELEPIEGEETLESSLESKPEGEVVETEPKEIVPEKIDNPLEQYINELEKEVGTRRGESETPEAYALRLEVTKLRKERRTERKELFDKPKEEVPKVVEKSEEDGLLSQYNSDEVANFEKLFEAIAKKKGLVRKEELQAGNWDDKAQSILEDFQIKHKEYNDENLWTQFKEEFQSGKYNTRPQNPRLLTEIFNQIHNTVVPSKLINKANVAAGREKIQAVAHGGTTVPKGERKPIDPVLKQALKGFSDEELEELSQ